MRIRIALLACTALTALALVGCGPKPEESTPAPVVPKKDGAAAAPAANPGAAPAAAPAAGAPPAGASYSAGGMPPEMKARLQSQGAPIK